jgi:hypothetical protein
MSINFEFSQRILEQFSNMKFHENPSEKEPSCPLRRAGQADRRTRRFRNFTDNPKNEF